MTIAKKVVALFWKNENQTGLSTTAPMLLGPSKLQTRQFGSVVEVIFNSKKTLNALDAEMVQKLTEHLLLWRDDQSISVVMIRGAGDYAFCAGGDVLNLYTHLINDRFQEAECFFKMEYQLDYLIHNYPKPIVIWANGIVMGGGMGILQGGIRVVTENTKMSMPEVLIGMFPDVGAGWFLNRTHSRLGYLLALSACQITAQDAIYARLADYYLPHDCYEHVVDNLSQLHLKCSKQHGNNVFTVVHEKLLKYAQPLKDTLLYKYRHALEPLLVHADYTNMMSALKSIASSELAPLLKRTPFASSLTAKIAFQHLQRSRFKSLEEVFLQEYHLIRKLLRHGEFKEGIRALLIDKDQKPNWSSAPFVAEYWFDNALKTPQILKL